MDVLEAGRHCSDLQEHIYKLYRDHILCDVDIKTSDRKCFPAHKLVLTAASKLFYNWSVRNVLANSFSLGFQSDVVHILLEFCYTGKLIVTNDKWQTVFDAATYLEMENLVKLLRDATSSSQRELTGHGDGTSVSLTEPVKAQKRNFVAKRYSDDLNGEILVKEEAFTNISVGVNLPQSDNSNTVQAIAVSRTNYPGTRSRTGCRHHAIKNACSDYTKVRPSSIKVPRHKQAEILRSGLQKSSLGNEDFGSKDTSRISVTEGNSSRSRPTHSILSKGVKSKQKTGEKLVVEKNTDDSAEINKDNKRQKKGHRNHTMGSSGDENYIKTHKNRRKILLTINSQPTGLKVSASVKLKMKDKVSVPVSNTRQCSHCGKTYKSAVMLFRHCMSQHVTMNFAHLRSHYLMKLYKVKRQWSNYLGARNGGFESFSCRLCSKLFSKYSLFTRHFNGKHGDRKKPLESWLRYCSVKIMMQKLLVPFAKDVKVKDQQGKRQKLKQEQKFQCSDCGRRFTRKFDLQKHQRKIHSDLLDAKVTPQRGTRRPPEPLYVCVDCELQLSSHQALYAHLKKQHDYPSKEANFHTHSFPYQIPCEVIGCPYGSSNLQDLRDHVSEQHPNFKCLCPECPVSFKTSMALKRHKFVCHCTAHGFECRLCQRKFRKSGLLRQHEFFKHNIQHEGIKIHYCEHPGCNYKTYASSSIKLHRNKHKEGKLFPCDFCDMKLRTSVIREKHIAKMHLGIRPFLCQVCGLSFGEKHELQSHINNRHSSEKEYQCQYCTYSTNVKGTFFTHVFNVHKVQAEEDKRKVYYCPQCPFKSILRHRYQTHVNGHTDTRNYMCKLCNKTFVSSSTLRSHNQWKHSDKTYSCRQCDYQTKTSQKLNEHIRVQHQLQGFKPYKCPYCSFRCATGGNTRKHVKQVHKDQPVTYIRDDGLIDAARVARASGNFSSLFSTLSTIDMPHETNDDDRSELSENILQIAL